MLELPPIENGRTHVACRLHAIAKKPRLAGESKAYAPIRQQTAMKHITPPTIRPPFARYSYGVEIPAGHRILVCSGQLGITPQDHVPATIEEQTHLCFRNIGAVLAEAGFAFADVVR